MKMDAYIVELLIYTIAWVTSRDLNIIENFTFFSAEASIVGTLPHFYGADEKVYDGKINCFRF